MSSLQPPSPPQRRLHRAVLATGLLGILVSAPAWSQPVFGTSEDLDFDRPEAWAMAWFAAVMFPTALASGEALDPGAVELSFESGWVPTLSEEQRTVGFIGTKPEDINRTAVFARPRGAVGLPAKLTATLSWAPPVELDGVEPNVLSLSLTRPLWEGERWRLSARLLGTRGTIRGDLSCPADVVAGRKPNPVGCEAPSRDEMSLRLLGLELQAGTTLARWPRLSPYAALARNRLHAEFQVDALRNGFRDRTLKETDGNFWSGTVGLSVDAGSRARLAGELFYTPLDVVGRAGKGEESDGLFNARLLLAYRLR